MTLYHGTNVDFDKIDISKTKNTSLFYKKAPQR